ncbi:MAG: hypothetical protein ACFFG0_12195 [Candidatus Thorarchaeota archaeon]
MCGKKIVLDYDEFKEFVESIENQYKQTYKGDWDWARHTTFEVKEGYVLKKDRYYNNGTKPPDDSDEKILPFKFIENQIKKCHWWRCYKDRGTICVCENKEALKAAGINGSQGVVKPDERETCRGNVLTPECRFYEPKK